MLAIRESDCFLRMMLLELNQNSPFDHGFIFVVPAILLARPKRPTAGRARPVDQHLAVRQIQWVLTALVCRSR